MTSGPLLPQAASSNVADASISAKRNECDMGDDPIIW
jgi:hypothetical protein